MHRNIRRSIGALAVAGLLTLVAAPGAAADAAQGGGNSNALGQRVVERFIDLLSPPDVKASARFSPLPS